MITDFSSPDVWRRRCPTGQLALRLRNYAGGWDHQRPDHRRAIFADGARRVAQLHLPNDAERERAAQVAATLRRMS